MTDMKKGARHDGVSAASPLRRHRDVPSPGGADGGNLHRWMCWMTGNNTQSIKR